MAAVEVLPDIPFDERKGEHIKEIPVNEGTVFREVDVAGSQAVAFGRKPGHLLDFREAALQGRYQGQGGGLGDITIDVKIDTLRKTVTGKQLLIFSQLE